MIFKKDNRGKEQQPYIPPGNGSESGEYTYKDPNCYSSTEECSDSELKKLLSSDEYTFIRKYSIYSIGITLNKAIREKCLSRYGMKMRDCIISAIKKYKIKNDIKVFRGIKVSKEIYVKEFYNKYIKGEMIEGSLICSTSRDFKRAIRASISSNPSDVSLVFELNLPRGFNALPIEDIAVDNREREILISKPWYKIIKFERWHYGEISFTKVILELER